MPLEMHSLMDLMAALSLRLKASASTAPMAVGIITNPL